MSCASCSTGSKEGEATGGCRNNGTCGTSGCNKLNVHNWLSDMELPAGQLVFPYVEIRFKGTRKEFYKNKDNIPLRSGDVVAVESSPGHDIGVVSLTGELVRLQMKKKGIKEDSGEIKAIYRIAKPADLEKWEEVKQLEDPGLFKTRECAKRLKLNMKVNDVEYQGDRKKITVYYTAEHRVDFRELIKMLGEEFKVRVEMRQIGMRQEAGRLGGLGDCGRELCCSTWLTNFKTVTTSAARYQNLSLNPAKLAGQCGKLKCCLNYELDSYMDAIKDFPDTELTLQTEKGTARHQKTDIFRRVMWYAYIVDRAKQDAMSDSWVALPVDRVKEIIAQNKNKTKPADLSEGKLFEVVEKLPDYENVVGQDSLTRMDHLKKKKKKKNNRNRDNRGNPGNAGGNAGTPNPGASVKTNNPPRQQNRPNNPPNPNRPNNPPNPNRPNNPPNPNRSANQGGNNNRNRNNPNRNQPDNRNKPGNPSNDKPLPPKTP